jgi:hypothetical protein
MPVRTKNERIFTYKQGLEMLGVPYNEKAKEVYSDLIADGHTEKSICFSIYKTYDKLARFAHDNRFWGVFKNEVLKWSWPRGDPRWETYESRKQQTLEIKARQTAFEHRQKELQNFKSVSKGNFSGFVYFIQGENGGPVKIGYSTDVAERLKDLQTGHPDTLVCLDFFPGSPAMEALIHKDLKAYRLRPNGEWFKPDPYVLERMKKYKDRALELKETKQKRSKTR